MDHRQQKPRTFKGTRRATKRAFADLSHNRDERPGACSVTFAMLLDRWPELKDSVGRSATTGHQYLCVIDRRLLPLLRQAPLDKLRQFIAASAWSSPRAPVRPGAHVDRPAAPASRSRLEPPPPPATAPDWQWPRAPHRWAEAPGAAALAATARQSFCGLGERLRSWWDHSRPWLLVLPVGVLAVRAWSRRWVTEDSFINFRVVDVTLRGRQPFAFNVGERVEAGTSPLWVAALVVLEATLGWLVDLEWLSLVVGLGLTLVGLAAAVAASTLLLRRTGAAGQRWPAGALVLAVLPPMWDFATSGMETGLTFGWLGVCYLLLARRYVESFDATPTQRPPPTSPRWLPVVLGLGPLIRPDLFLFTVAFMVAHLALSRPGIGGRIRAIAGALILPGAFQAFRMAYFAALVPNTALVKEASAANWAKGFAYLENYAGTYWLFVPGVVAAGWAALWLHDAAHIGGHRLVVLVAAPAAAALLHAAYVTRVGGDFMHGRLLLPATFGLFMAAAALPVVPAGATSTGGFRVGRITITAVAAGALTAWAVTCGTRLRLTDRPPARWSDIFDERAWWHKESGRRNPVTLDDYRRVDAVCIGRRARQLAARGADVLVRIDGTEQSLAPWSGVILEAITIGLGSRSAGPGVHVFDVLGLGDAVGSRIPADPRGRIGHQKRLPRAFMFARILGASDDDLPRDVDRATLQAARWTLRSPAVARLLDATQDPLTPLRALRNVLRSPALTRLRVPSARAQQSGLPGLSWSRQ